LGRPQYCEKQQRIRNGSSQFSHRHIRKELEDDAASSLACSGQ